MAALMPAAGSRQRVSGELRCRDFARVWWRCALTRYHDICQQRGHPDESHPTVEDFICDLTLLQGLSSPTMSSPTTPRNAGGSPNCKDNIQWFSFSAAEVTAPRTAGRLKG